MTSVNCIGDDRKLIQWETILRSCFLYNLKPFVDINIQNLFIPLQISITRIFRELLICIHSISSNRQHNLETFHSSIFMSCSQFLSRFIISRST